jgi:type IV pilus assembly protein PilO
MAKSLHELSPRAQTIVFVLLAVLLLGGAWQVVLSPMRTELETRRDHLDSLETRVMAAELVAAKLPVAQREVRDLEVALHETTAVIPEEKDPQDVLRHLHELASQSLLQIASFAPKAIVTKAQYSEWPIELGFEGGYHDLGVFFDRIAAQSRLMSVSDLHIKVKSRPGARGSIQATCVATTFVFKKDTAPTMTTTSAAGGRP